MSKAVPAIASIAIPIPAGIIRRAGDAAFIWHQHDQPAYSGIVSLPQLQGLDRLLEGGFDGLRVACFADIELHSHGLTLPPP